MLALFFRYLFEYNKEVDIAVTSSFVNSVITHAKLLGGSTIDLLEAMFACAEGELTQDEYVDGLWKCVKTDFISDGDFIIEYEAVRCILQLCDFSNLESSDKTFIADLLDKSNKMFSYLTSLGVC